MTLFAGDTLGDSVLLKLFCVTECGVKFFLGFKIEFERVANFAVRAVCLEKHRLFVFGRVSSQTSYVSAVIAVFFKSFGEFRDEFFDFLDDFRG